MREIKFRAWSKEEGMINVARLDIADGSLYKRLITGKAYDYWNDVILMQYTGLKDKNGKEIYEGDIVKNNFAETIGSVMFADCGYWIKTIDKDIFGDTIYCDLGDYDGEVLEVIGNIYQNTELLKEGE